MNAIETLGASCKSLRHEIVCLCIFCGDVGNSLLRFFFYKEGPCTCSEA